MLAFLKLSMSGIFAFVAAAGVIGLATWFLAKRRMQKIRLPTLRVLRFNTKKLPKFVVIPPPLVPFLCFAGAAALLVLFGLRPRLADDGRSQAARINSLFVLDLSPSVSARVSIGQYRESVRGWYERLQGRSEIYLMSSSDLPGRQPVRVRSPAELERILAGKEFHSPGLKIGSLFTRLGAGSAEYDRFFIFSDGDRHSWEGFNWRFLTANAKVFHVPLPQAGSQAQNAYIREVSQAEGARDDSVRGIEVVIGRSAAAGTGSGRLTLKFNDERIAEAAYAFSEGVDRISVTLAGAIATALGAPEADGGRLRFELEPGEADGLVMDNRLSIDWRPSSKGILLVGGYQGERFLFDPTYDLQMSLKVLGFDVRRVDAWQPDLGRDLMKIIMVEPGQPSALYCPRPAAPAAAGGRTAENAAAAGTESGREPVIWFVPTHVPGQSEGDDAREVCRCLSRLTGQDAGGGSCGEASNPQEWARVLRAMGGKQFGGTVGKEDEAMAWSFSPDQNELRAKITVFLPPLRARPFGFFSNASLPLLIKDLIQLESFERLNPLADLRQHAVSDIAALTEPLPDGDQRLMNVPVDESLLQESPTEALPPLLRVDLPDEAFARDEDKQENVIPVVSMLILLGTCLLLIESAYHLWLRFAKANLLLALPLLLLPVVAFNGPAAEAQVALAVLGYGPEVARAAVFSSEIESRTSIEMSSDARIYATAADAGLLKEPWLWVRDPGLLRENPSDGGIPAPGKDALAASLSPRFQLWLRRGGFLMIDGMADPEALKRLTARNDLILGDGEGWGPIPPDHEIMRSFYLLDSLPTCGDRVWYGYQFDGRLAILASPYPILADRRMDGGSPGQCPSLGDQELIVRTFVNIVMVSLATDYKKDQIHLPEILKRLRQ